jgi:hypothetical protein
VSLGVANISDWAASTETSFTSANPFETPDYIRNELGKRRRATGMLISNHSDVKNTSWINNGSEAGMNLPISTTFDKHMEHNNIHETDGSVVD